VYAAALDATTGRAAISEVSIPIPDKSERPRRREAVAGSVTATQLGEHLDLTRQRVGVLADVDHVLQRPSDGRFDLDAARVSYIRHLRTERARSPKAAADAEHTAAKAALLHIQIAERQKRLVLREDADALIDSIAGVVLTALSSLPARCAPRGDLAIRRSIEQAVREVRAQIAAVCEQRANANGEPPLSEQG
jgi:hypothetical protein